MVIGAVDRINAAFKALTATPSALDLFNSYGSSYFAYPRNREVDGAYTEAKSASYAEMYRTQENIRIVVDAVSRAAAKRALRCYEDVPGGGTQEDKTFGAIETMRAPNDWQAGREILTALYRDKLLYDDAYLFDFGVSGPDTRFLVRIPAFAVGVKTNGIRQPVGYELRKRDGTVIPFDVSQVYHWRGYSPSSSGQGTSPMEALRVMLIESSVRKYRMIEMIRGGLIRGGIVKRAIDAPEWSPKARDRFEEAFSGKLRGVATGGVAMLEDGMDFQDAGISPREAELLAGRQLDLATVCNVFGFNTGYFTELGNLAQAREMMDEDVVEPMVHDLADVLTHQLIRRTYNDKTHYFSFRRPPITDMAQLFTAAAAGVGGSVMTPNEFRDEYLDMPPNSDTHADELAQHPGAQSASIPPSPGSQPRGRPTKRPADQARTTDNLKSIRDAIYEGEIARKAEHDIQMKAQIRQKAMFGRRDQYAAQIETVVANHFNRQKAATSGGRAVKANSKRWNDELAADLLELTRDQVDMEGNLVAKRLLGSFDVTKADNYLKAGSVAMARYINDATQKEIDDTADIAAVLTAASVSRAPSIAAQKASLNVGFATEEAAVQNPVQDGYRVKTWVSSGKKTSRHAHLHGETVPINEQFSNGLSFPGDPAGDPNEIAGCTCMLDVR